MKHPNIFAAFLLATVGVAPGAVAQERAADDPEARPAVTATDLKIVQRARALIASEAQWNRADDRRCAPAAASFSMYCALQQATRDAGRAFEHRGAALQEVRFVIDEITVERGYDHRLMDYNNDPRTRFADMQQVFHIAEELLALRLATPGERTSDKPQ